MAEFEQLIAGIVENTGQCLDDIHLLPKAEQQLLADWNQTDRAFSSAASIPELIEAQARTVPNKTAVVCGRATLSYAELTERSHQLACYLRDQGIQPGDYVALALPRSEWMLIAILGVLKAGAAYLPLDPEYPEARLNAMLDTAKAALLITVETLQARFPDSLRRLVLDSPKDVAAIGQTALSALPAVSAESLAYVIFTSGSTGQPKGVEVEHLSVVNFLQSMAKKPGMQSDDILLAVTTLSFDIAVLELLLPLVVGAKVVIASREVAADGDVLMKTIEQQKITMMQATPATWQMLVDAGWEGSDSLKILSGGEALPLCLAKSLNVRSASLWNMYGPTETTIWSSCCEIKPGHTRISIGKPISNTRFFILDDHWQPLPVGVAGELYIAGAGVVRGYLRRTDLTAERFIVHQGERLYRSGDLARFLPNGDVEHLGRVDDQVKLRGFRIELGEVETVLSQYPGVNAAVAAVKAVLPGDKRLVAYFVSDEHQNIDVADLRDYCLRKLPEYMVPQYYQPVAEFPLTPNGKTDRQALPDPDGGLQTDSQDFVAAETVMEQQVADVWQSVLRIDSLGINDNFFHLGGHSLLATQIVSRLRRALKQTFPVSVLFECPTARLMAARLETLEASDVSAVPEIKPGAENTAAPLSQTQQRLLFLQQLYPDSAVFNQIGVWRLKGAFDIDAFKAALAHIVQRHDILRSQIVHQDGAEVLLPSQRVNPVVMIEDLQEKPQAQRESALQTVIEQMANAPFDLEQNALLRVKIALLGPQECVLLVMSHPIIWDGWSFDVFLQEFAGFYQAEKHGAASPFPALTLQYADYPAWHQNWMAEGEGERQIQYWKETLQGASTHIAIARDYDRPRVPSYQGAREPLFISKSQIETLTRLAHAEGVTLYMVLLAAFNVLLYRQSQQEEIVIATQVQGRVRPEFEHLIGPFVNTLLLRSRLNNALDFREFLQQTRQTCLQAFAHQDVPFEQVMAQVALSKGSEHASPYQVMFTFQDTTNRDLQFADLEISQINHNTQVAYTDILFWLKETGEGLHGGLDYSTDLFNASSMSRLMAGFQQILSSIVENPHTKIDQIPLLMDQTVLPDGHTGDEISADDQPEAIKTCTPIQQRIIDIWSEALEIDEIDIYDNFFELGGHSLLSMQVLAKIRTEMDVHIPARAILMDNLAQIAAYCESGEAGGPVEKTATPSPQKKPARSRMISRLSKPLGLLRSIKKSPDAAGKKQQAEYEARFSQATAENLFRGVYSSFSEALQTAPGNKPTGYDHSDPANMYKDRLERIYPDDYPMMFWLEKALAEGGHQVFDLGGHIGVGFYAYQKYIQYPEDMDWKVCDVAAVVEAGEKLSRKRKADQLSFTTDNQAADGRDIFFASGALQYLDTPLATQLSKLQQPPKHILLNLMPLYNGDAFVTLQNIGTAFCPYQILNKTQFIESLQQQGYDMIDHWENPDKGCQIPFHPEQSLDHYDGFYFRRR
ncbi:MAG TPA: amino acid adenylation domain-containing protein, partial [Gammaproteobacteria bacterium]|nr:amino acid adenylation domain-containing protein [Gammaproteobacteria bacterium]